MKYLYTIILEAGGGTFVDQQVANSTGEALQCWANNPHQTVLSAFRIPDARDLRGAVKQVRDEASEAITPLDGLRSVWFVHLEINGVDGFLNLIRTDVS